MSKCNLLKDYLASRVVADNKVLESDEYGKMYYRTNEDLVEAYLDTDFQGKEVLSVLASSDQVFTARVLEAKTVDAFDKNRLTLYYFYLRLWTLKYEKELYPHILERGARNWLKELLKKVKPENETEKKALLFFIKHQQVGTNYSSLFFDEVFQPSGAVLFRNAKDLENCLSPELNYSSMDFFQPQKSEKKYDIVLMSNILDWAREDKGKLKIAADNLGRMIRKDGVVICSTLVFRSREKQKNEKELFAPYFEREDKDYSYIYHRK